MKYDAIMFDLDGTAMPSAFEALPNDVVAGAIQKNKTKLHLCAATGRTWLGAKAVVEKLGLIDPCIISGGSLIIDPITEEILWDTRISHEDALEIQRISKDHEYVTIYTDRLIRKESDSIAQAKITGPLNTIYIMNVPKEVADEITKKLAHIKDITISGTYAWKLEGGRDIHITHKEATKEHGVIELCNILGVDRSKVAGVGDGFNDIHLFNAVGYKVAMGNAAPELKELADLVIAPETENGLAQFIESARNT